MANKDRNKRSARKARAEERARVEAAQAATTGSQPAKAVAKAEKKPETKPEKKKAVQRRTHPAGHVVLLPLLKALDCVLQTDDGQGKGKETYDADQKPHISSGYV